MKKKLLSTLLLLIAYSVLSAQNFVNGSFETNDYSGWILLEDSGIPDNGIFGLESSGNGVIDGNDYFDFYDGVNITHLCFSMPAFTATGSMYGFNGQNGPENHRMYQDITLSATAENLEFDIAYETSEFDAANQYLAVHVRNATTDAIIETLFKTTDGVDPISQPQTTFSFDISAYAGTTVRFDFEFQVQFDCFSIQYDNFNITDSSLSDNDYMISNFVVYPNPVSDFISLSGLSGQKVSSAEIFNTLGKKVFQLDEKSLNSKGRASVSNLNSGIYFLKLQFAEKGTVIKKLVIE